MANRALLRNGLVVTGSIEVQNAVTASAFSGDGSALTGIQHTDISALNTFTGSIQTQVNTLEAATASYATTSSVDTLTAATSSYLTSIPSTYLTTTAYTTETITKNLNYDTSLNIAEISSSVEGAIIDYRLTSLDSGSRTGIFSYSHNGATLGYKDTIFTTSSIGDQPTLSATLTGSIVSIDIENAAGFNFSGFAKKFDKLGSAVIVADPNTNYLFDSYPNATLAYSLRQLNQLYTGSALRVREDGSNTETDIGFDINGELDVASIISHCGSNNGYVTTWYDQSGNTNNATQSLANDQPLIYNGSSINETNGKPSLSFSGGRILLINNPVTTATNFLLSAVNTAAANQFPWGGSDSFLFYASTSTTRFRGLSSDLNYVRTVPTAGTQEHYVVDLSSGTATFRVNAITGVTGARSADATLGTLGDGQGNTSGRHTGTIQEFIIWNSSQLQARSGIETNTNNYYSIYDTGLLETYQGAYAAHSVRQLTTAFTSSMNIRRASDNTETIIGFTSAGDLDTGSIETFCNGTECYVDTWYDQSGNGNHAEQANASYQALIYSASSIISESNHPALLFDGTNDLYTTIVTAYSQSDSAMFGVGKARSGISTWATLVEQGSGQFHQTGIGYRTSQVYLPNPTDTSTLLGTLSTNLDYSLFSVYIDSETSSSQAYINETLLGTHNYSSSDILILPTSDRIQISKIRGVNGTNWKGTIQEIIVYNRSTKDDHNNITGSINSYYNIY
jgi:hypothetical protein